MSNRIGDKNELQRLGEVVLKLPENKIRSALTTNPGDIQTAAHDVLSDWVRQQTDRKTAFKRLRDALVKNQMSYLTEEFFRQNENLTGISKISKFCVLCKLFQINNLRP